MTTVHFELHGIQRFIFRSQRLRAMLGGNRLIQQWLDRSSQTASDLGWAVHESAGGHLEVSGDGDADLLIERVIAHLHAIAPGMTASIHVNGLPRSTAYYADLLAQPFLQPCAEFGSVPAVERFKGYGLDVYVSRDFAARSRARQVGKDDDKLEIEDFADRGYVALIKLDGNGFGTLAAEAARDERIALADVFRALRDARHAAFDQAIKALKGPLHRVLMDAGDDLLLIMKPRHALAFVHAFASAWSERSHGHDYTRRASFAAGVVIAHYKLPIVRLEQLAEELCASAKRHSRRSFAVDWVVCTQAWMDDLLTQRRRDCMVRQSLHDRPRTLLLTEKPLYVRRPQGKDDGPPWSLEELLALERSMHDKGAPVRSQWRALLAALRQGVKQGELAYLKLKRQGSLPGLPVAATRVLSVPGAREELYVTPLGDLVELHEISMLGKGKVVQEDET